MKAVKLLFLTAGLFLMAGYSAMSYAEESPTAYVKNTAAYVKNSAITADVKAKFLTDPDIKSTHITVTTKKGVVTLTGYVNTAEQKQKAVSIASQVNGVKSVKDKLVIKPIE